MGDPSRARERLGWEPEVSFEKMIAEMVENDLRLLGESVREPAHPRPVL